MTMPLVPLGQVASITHGFAFAGDSWTPPAPGPNAKRVVSIGNFNERGGFVGKFKGYSGDYPIAYELRAGDVLFVMTCQTADGEILGLPAIVPDDGHAYLHNQRIGKLVIRDPELLDGRYMYYVALSQEFNRQLYVTATGTKILHTSPGRMESALIPLPPKPEQEAIADVLGALDDKIASNQRVAELSEERARLEFQLLSNRARAVALTELAVPHLGGTPARAKREDWGGPVNWASAKDVAGASSHVIIDTEESISEAASTSAARLAAHPEGSVVITARGTVGAVARLGIASAINQSCYAFRPAVDVPPALLYLAVLAGVDQMRAMAHGSVFSTITMTTLSKAVVPDVRVMGSREGPISDLLDAVKACVVESRTLADMRGTLLPQLMSGKLRVKDAERQVSEAT